MTKSLTASGALVPVHGGLSEPVDRVVPLSRRREFLEEAASLPTLEVSRADLSTVHRLADGALSPLTGPMRRFRQRPWGRRLALRDLIPGPIRIAMERSTAPTCSSWRRTSAS